MSHSSCSADLKSEVTLYWINLFNGLLTQVTNRPITLKQTCEVFTNVQIRHQNVRKSGLGEFGRVVVVWVGQTIKRSSIDVEENTWKHHVLVSTFIASKEKMENTITLCQNGRKKKTSAKIAKTTTIVFIWIIKNIKVWRSVAVRMTLRRQRWSHERLTRVTRNSHGVPQGCVLGPLLLGCYFLLTVTLNLHH